MRKLLFALILFSCNSSQERNSNTDSVIVVNKAAAIETERSSVNPKPVKVYSKPIEGSGLQGEFAVRLFETKQTFHYLMKIRYAEFTATDTLKLPNFGTEPNPDIISYKEPNSCIVGFYDRKNKFYDYKLVQVKNDRVKIKALNHFAVATYQQEVSSKN